MLCSHFSLVIAIVFFKRISIFTSRAVHLIFWAKLSAADCFGPQVRAPPKGSMDYGVHTSAGRHGKDAGGVGLLFSRGGFWGFTWASSLGLTPQSGDYLEAKVTTDNWVYNL